MRKVVLTVAHADSKVGAVSPDGKIKEYTHAKALDIRLADELFKEGVEVILIEEPGGLRRKAQRAIDAKPDCVIELHLDANWKQIKDDKGNVLKTVPNLRVQGYFPIYWVSHRASQDLAETVAASMKATFDDWRCRGPQPCPGPMIYRKTLTLLEQTAAVDVPAIMIECGTLTHPEDVARLLDPGTPGKMAEAITAGVIEWMNRKEGVA
jgi:N-acetylmuramoyl-L-alanine amidase